MQLYRMWYGAGRAPVLCSDYNQRVARGTGNGSEAREVARQGYLDALRGLPKGFYGVVVAVCLIGESAQEWAEKSGRRGDVGIEYLRDGLDVLIEHFGGSRA